MNLRYRFTSVALLGLTTGLLAHAQSAPPVTGRAEFQRICSGCHSVDRATSQRLTRAEWTSVVNDMVGRGAQGSSTELDDVVTYLSSHFGKSNAPAAAAPPLAPASAAPAATPPEVPTNEPPRISEATIQKARELMQANSCLSCHRVNGNGSFVGPYLSDIGAHRSPEQLRAALLSPKQEVLPEDRTVRLITHDDKTVTGRLLNQDGFSVQLIDAAGQLRSFDKTSLREFTIVTANPMPSYAHTLGTQDLDDLVQYLSSLKGVGTP